MNRTFILTILTLSLFCSISLIYSHDLDVPPVNLSFHDLEQAAGEEGAPLDNYQGKAIQIRGFLYVTKEGQTVLASEPNLKSCCVGSEAKRGKQVLVYGNHFKESASDFAVTMTGILETDPNGKFLYHLKNGSIAEPSSYNPSHLVLGGLFFFILFGLGIRLVKHN